MLPDGRRVDIGSPDLRIPGLHTSFLLPPKYGVRIEAQLTSNVGQRVAFSMETRHLVDFGRFGRLVAQCVPVSPQ